MNYARPLLLTLTSLSTILLLSACGHDSTPHESEVKTIVGNGGAFFDKRVQIINSINNPLNNTTCIYISQFKSNEVPHFDSKEPLTQEQSAFLANVEKSSRPVTPYPISIAELEQSLSQKDSLRLLRGIISIPLGLVAAYAGFGLPFAFSAFSGSALYFFHPLAWPFLAGGTGGLFSLNQATRDLNPKNYGIRAEDMQHRNGLPPKSVNLGVTLAITNAAKSLKSVSQTACPRDLTATEMQPFALRVQSDYLQLNEDEKTVIANNSLKKLRNSSGCHFSARNGNERIVYHAQVGEQKDVLTLAAYVVVEKKSLDLLFEQNLTLQLSSDSGQGRKYVSDSKEGSIAIWTSQKDERTVGEAKLSHKLSSGAYAGNRPFVSGTCRL
jgi:hypothetical protein